MVRALPVSRWIISATSWQFVHPAVRLRRKPGCTLVEGQYSVPAGNAHDPRVVGSSPARPTGVPAGGDDVAHPAMSPACPARTASRPDAPRGERQDRVPASGAVVVLRAATVLAVYHPRSPTHFGRGRAGSWATAPAARPGTRRPRPLAPAVRRCLTGTSPWPARTGACCSRSSASRRCRQSGRYTRVCGSRDGDRLAARHRDCRRSGRARAHRPPQLSQSRHAQVADERRSRRVICGWLIGGATPWTSPGRASVPERSSCNP